MLAEVNGNEQFSASQDQASNLVKQQGTFVNRASFINPDSYRNMEKVDMISCQLHCIFSLGSAILSNC